MQRSGNTSAPSASTVPACSLAEHDAPVYGVCLRDLRQALLDPPEFLLFGERLQVLGAGRDRPVRDDLVLWFD
jgi:hypothetical protein